MIILHWQRFYLKRCGANSPVPEEPTLAKPPSERHSGIAELDERIPFLLAQLGAHISSDFQRRLSSIGADPARTQFCWHSLVPTANPSVSSPNASGSTAMPWLWSSTSLNSEDSQSGYRAPKIGARSLSRLPPRPAACCPRCMSRAATSKNEIAAPLSAKERDTLRRLLQRVAAGRGSFPEFIPNWRDRRSLTNRPARRGNALVGRIP